MVYMGCEIQDGNARVRQDDCTTALPFSFIRIWQMRLTRFAANALSIRAFTHSLSFCSALHKQGVVVKTGMQTKMGEIAHLLNTADEGETPLEQKLDK